MHTTSVVKFHDDLIATPASLEDLRFDAEAKVRNPISEGANHWFQATRPIGSYPKLHFDGAEQEGHHI